MSSQADFNKVNETVIKPMQRHWGAEFDADTLADFVDDLGRYDTATLKKAMQTLRGEMKRKPSLAHLIEACRHTKSASSSTSIYTPGSTGARMPWEDREDKRRDLVNAYVKSFKNTVVYFEASREGYDLQLIRYVQEVASVQAQMIHPGGNGIGWNSIVILGFAPEKAAIDQFFADQKRYADIGLIDVPIPTGRIREWQKQITYDRELAKRAASRAIKTIQPPRLPEPPSIDDIGPPIEIPEELPF